MRTGSGLLILVAAAIAASAIFAPRAGNTSQSLPITIARTTSSPVPAPRDLHYTTSVSYCNAHGIRGCGQLEDGNSVAFFWSWSGQGKIQGYVLKTAPSHRGQVSAVVGGSAPGNRFLVVDAPARGWRDACYAVSALRGTAESAPSPKRCVTATSKDVAVAPAFVRGYEKIYENQYRSTGGKAAHTFPVVNSLPLDVGEAFALTSGLQSSWFWRPGFAFDLKSLGSDTIFGGTFAYDFSSTNGLSTSPRNRYCTSLYLAPNGWDYGQFPPLPPNSYMIAQNLKQHGKSFEWPVDKFVRSWKPHHLVSFLLVEGSPAETMTWSLQPQQFSCHATVTNVRLITRVGTTQ